MITAILETKDGEIIGRSGRPGNEQFLIRHESDFSKPSLLSDIDYDVFAKSDMVELIGELMALQKTSANKINYTSTKSSKWPCVVVTKMG